MTKTQRVKLLRGPLGKLNLTAPEGQRLAIPVRDRKGIIVPVYEHMHKHYYRYDRIIWRGEPLYAVNDLAEVFGVSRQALNKRVFDPPSFILGGTRFITAEALANALKDDPETHAALTVRKVYP